LLPFMKGSFWPISAGDEAEIKLKNVLGDV
jgi:hypothetical protein